MGLNDKLSKASKDRKVRELVLEPFILALPTIPAPMHGTAPRVVLGSTWWDKTRKAAYRSTFYCCLACGTHQTLVRGGQKHLEGHEVYLIDYARGLMYYRKTSPLCPYCHRYCHRGRLRYLLESGKINHGTYRAIIQHGNAVLGVNGCELPVEMPYQGPMPDWGDWRLVIGNKKYPGLFQSQKDWEDYHSERNKEPTYDDWA